MTKTYEIQFMDRNDGGPSHPDRNWPTREKARMVARRILGRRAAVKAVLIEVSRSPVEEIAP